MAEPQEHDELKWHKDNYRTPMSAFYSSRRIRKPKCKSFRKVKPKTKRALSSKELKKKLDREMLKAQILLTELQLLNLENDNG